MKIKKIIYQIIKYPLILIFIKTPLLIYLKRRFMYRRSINNMGSININIIHRTLDAIFDREYYLKLENKEEFRLLSDMTLSRGNGRRWAEHYYENHFLNLDELKKRRIGNMSYDEATLIFSRVIEYLNNVSINNKNLYLMQIGSSSGRDLEFFYKLFPHINYISTDINNEILNFQKEKYKYKNFDFYKCHAEDIDKCIKEFSISDKELVIISIGSLQYVNQFFISDFFHKISKYNNMNLFLMEPVSLSFLKNDVKLSDNRAFTSFSHNYKKYSKNLITVEEKIITPYSINDKKHGDTAHYYLHLKS